MAEQVKDLSIEYDAIPFALSEYASMKELFRSAFHARLTYQHFTTRFNTSVLGEEVIGFIAKDKSSNIPAAYYGVFPVKVKRGNEIFFAAQSGDTMTHEDHRKKGLFVWLAKMTFEKCRDKGIEVVFGLPNKNSYPGFINRLNWLQKDDISSYDLKVSPGTLPVAKIFLKSGLFKLYIQIALRLLRNYIVKTPDVFMNPLSNEESAVYREKNYLAYKRSINKVFIQINGVIVWISFTDVLWIGDFHNYELVDAAVVRKLKRIAAYLGYNTIRFNLNTQVQPKFLNYFKRVAKEPLCFFYIGQKLRNSNLVLTAADFDTW